jgi:hypothetical protein
MNLINIRGTFQVDEIIENARGEAILHIER